MSFASETAKSAKAIDIAFVVAGWPIIYTIGTTRTTAQLPATGDLSTANGFTAARAWASIPDSIGESAKGRPEEGTMTIAQVDVSVLDRYAGGKREISDLLSREAYLDAALARAAALPDAPSTPTGIAATLNTAASVSATTLNLASDAAALSASGGIVYIGLECIKYGACAPHGDGTYDLTGCQRGYLLTTRNPHQVGAKVFTFMPTLFRQTAYIYKGYASLDLSGWQRGFGGVIVGAAKRGAKVTFSAMSTMWLAYTDGREVLAAGVKPADASGNPTPQLHRTGTLGKDVLAGDFSNVVIQVDDATNLGNGHYIANVAGHWMAIKSAS